MNKLMAALLFFSTIALAQPRWLDDKDAPRGPGAMTDRLKLDDDQQKQFDKLRSAVQKQQISLRSKIETLRLEIRDAFREGNPERTKIESKLNEITKLQGDMKSNHLGFWFDVNKILTPDQQKIWKDHAIMGGRGERMPRQMHRPGMRMEMGREDMDCPCCD